MKQKTIFIVSLLLNHICFASGGQQLISGAKSLNTYAVGLGLAIAAIAFTISGVLFMFNKQNGADKFGGALIGTIIVGSGSGIVSLIAMFFN